MRTPPRRGVLMLVVLSLLVLFLLIGTAFLMTSDQSQKSAKQLAKKDRTGNYATRLLDRALFTLLRDTDNPYSAARFHSLLRDLYGGDGFEAVVLRAEYAGVTEFPATAPSGPTVGQLIDIYVATDPSSALPVAFKLDRDPFGAKLPYNLSSLRGYFNGQLLTITGGAASGQTARIVDYEVIPDASGAPIAWRLRVMAFPRSDGRPLAPDATNQLADLTGATFVVNGRAFNGTGAGYNVLAQSGQPRLNAVEVLFPTSATPFPAEIALTPNAAYFNPTNDPGLIVDPVSGLPIPYGRYAGPGDTDESYDAPDYQNIWLGWQTVTPRRRGRFVTSAGLFDVDDPNAGSGQFLRFELEDLPKPSFHDMALVNFWYHRLVNYLMASAGLSADQAVQAILQPFDPSLGLAPDQAALVASLKRKIMFRPSRDDHPKFDGGNPLSVPSTNAPLGFITPSGMISYPFWEIVGPWDVDNDGDRIPDSVWIDLGDPVEETENGTRYRTLVAVLIVDLDSKLNVNAHGTVKHFSDRPPGVNLAMDDPNTPLALRPLSSRLPQGPGEGPPEISLRPVFGVYSFDFGTPADDYWRLLLGRAGTGLFGRQGSLDMAAVMGIGVEPGMTYLGGPGPPDPTDPTTMDPLAIFKFIGHPWWVGNYYNNPAMYQPTAFGTPSDLFGRYTQGLDFLGQPVYEAAREVPGRPLLMGSPYETDLSSSARKDALDPAEIGLMMSGPSPPLDDDAAFATADLERILRAPDADAGTLPSRLWDLVSAFDPVKMQNDHANYVGAASSLLFGASGNAEALATAQLLASVNRRSVTTDSYDLPVPGQTMPGYVREMGPDGAPGVATMDDDGVNGVDDAGEIGFPGSDDFQGLTGTSYHEATLVDLLRYRIQTERIKRFLPPFDWTDISAGGGKAQFDFLVNQLTSQILAPELIAGQRMDINRPFGDGRDSSLTPDGVVDDPLEAGDPFLDANSDGKYQVGEPFIDIDGNNTYTPPQDQLWQELIVSGAITEPFIAFDYLNGSGEPVHPALAPPTANVRNLESQGRQRLARHLYCLMLLLADENYIAPIDEHDPQIASWIAIKQAELTDPMLNPTPLSPEQANLVARRKLTCREIAQWAINVVDQRDADAIMTPFEYDENPWDGWGVLDGNGVPLPLDGDPATDENIGQVIVWSAAAGSGQKVIAPSSPGVMPVVPPLPGVAQPAVVNQTRGLVFGAERPDLLITESLATFSRETEDLSTSHGNQHKTMNETDPMQRDDDPDQRLRPKSSLFVELANPWSPDGQYPFELYSRLDRSNGYAPNDASPGIELGRLSNLADANGVLTAAPSSPAAKRSPVWRMVVVSEEPHYRNVDSFDDARADVVGMTGMQPGLNLLPNLPMGADADIQGIYTTAAAAVRGWQPTQQDPLPPFRPTDLDLPAVFNFDFLPSVVNPAATPANGAPYQFRVAYPFIEREFYFTTDNSLTTANMTVGKPPIRDVTDANFQLRIPANRTIAYTLGSGVINAQPFRQETQRFVAYKSNTDLDDVDIAPILPGRYGVIGSAGVQYGTALPAGTFATLIGRNRTATDDTRHYQASNVRATRRIELVPSANPNSNQVFVRSNGGDPAASQIGRQNELMGTGQNIYDANAYQAAVAVPVDGMNVTEPPWGWGSVEYKLRREEFNSPRNPQYETSTVQPEGEYQLLVSGVPTGVSFDLPFDRLMGAGELSRTGTTANYRTIHLQRLANPLLPWNPLPGRAGHVPTLPVNPYRTIDVASVDMTAFDGASNAESSYSTTVKNNLAKWKPFGSDRRNVAGFGFLHPSNQQGGEHRQRWNFKSLERGVFARLGLTDPVPMVAAQPQRSLYAQEPAIGTVKDLSDTTSDNRTYINIRDGRETTTQADLTANEIPMSVRTSENIQPNFIDMVLEHSLGFGNESMGELYDRAGAPTASAIGAPSPAAEMSGYVNTATYPWLAWNNRPFVSAEEVLQAPTASNAKLLAQFSMVNPNVQSNMQPNPYGGLGLGDSMSVPTNADRWKALHAPFGHLANMFASSTVPADVVRNPATGIPKLDGQGDVQPYGGPNFYRILEYVQVPSRFVGTETVLSPDVFNDMPGAADVATGGDILGPNDPRYLLQPPFNKVSRQRDPGRVNLNTVTSRRAVDFNGVPRIWSEVFDGIMHRTHDAPLAGQSGHFGPAWRDVVLSRKAFPQYNANSTGPNDSVEKPALPPNLPPDVFSQGLNPAFPTFMANPFRSPDAGDLVPTANMVQQGGGVDATWLRRHHFTPGNDNVWGAPGVDDDIIDPSFPVIDDARDAGFGDDALALNPADSRLPLFSETFPAAFFDGERNPAMMYEPMTRLANLVTTRSNVFAVWITVGRFEVEKAPDWSDPVVQARFGNDINLYNRVYPEGYTLGRELGSDTGDVERHRGFYIIDRTQEVGFKPGEDLNVEKMILLRRRID